MAAELMDGRCLHIATSIPGVPKSWNDVSEDAGALLVEFRASQTHELTKMEEDGIKFASSLDLHDSAQFSRDPKAAAILWKVREGSIQSWRFPWRIRSCLGAQFQQSDPLDSAGSRIYTSMQKAVLEKENR